jgi:hypothetical protein
MALPITRPRRTYLCPLAALDHHSDTSSTISTGVSSTAVVHGFGERALEPLVSEILGGARPWLRAHGVLGLPECPFIDSK